MSAWLSIIGIGEDGLAGLGETAKAWLAGAEIVFGGRRHLALAGVTERGREWPVPFSVAPLLACRGRPVVALCSGDPFWHGAGSLLAEALPAGEWQACSAPSTAALAVARLGWRLEDVVCVALHAAPFAQMRRHLTSGARVICLLRGPEAAAAFGEWLRAVGFGKSRLWWLQALGGERERVFAVTPEGLAEVAFGEGPLAIGIEVVGAGLPRTPGLPDAMFTHDGQITKRHVRALTLSALAPRAGEHLWDIGAGSGSVGIEWLLAAPGGSVSAVEADAARGTRAMENAAAFGVAELFALVQARAPEGLEGLARPDAVFIGGGASEALLERIFALAPAGARLVANAVTLESEALFSAWAAEKGGSLLRIELAEAAALGSKRGWTPARPIVQWSVTL